MKKLRFILLFLLFSAIPFLGLVQFGHTGVTDNITVGSCSALSLGGNATSSSSESGDSGTASFSTGEPIDIPVSIAKGVEPVDATQFQAEFGGGANLIKAISGVKQVAGQTIVITGKTKQTNVTVVAYVEGNQVFEQNVGDDRIFTMTTTTAIYGTPIAFVVRGDSGYTSYPVIVTIEAPSSLFDFLVSTLHVTNITGIAVRTPAVSNDDVAYVALNIFDEPLIAVTLIDGGYPNLFSDEPTSLLNYIQYSSDGTFMIGIAVDGTIYKIISADGSATVIGSTNVTNADFRLSPDDAYVVTHYNNSGSYAVKLIDLADTSNTTILTASTDTVDNTAINYEWLTEDLLLVLKSRSGGSQVTDIYNLNSVLGTDFSATTTITPTTVRTSSALLTSNPRVDPFTQAQYAGVCVSGSSNALCLDNFTDKQAVVDADQGLLDIANPTWTANGELIIFDALPASDTSSRVLAAYIVDTDETLLLGYGFNPKASPRDANIVMYQSYDITGEIQMGLINLAKHSQTAGLFD